MLDGCSGTLFIPTNFVPSAVKVASVVILTAAYPLYSPPFVAIVQPAPEFGTLMVYLKPSAVTLLSSTLDFPATLIARSVLFVVAILRSLIIILLPSAEDLILKTP